MPQATVLALLLTAAVAAGGAQPVVIGEKIESPSAVLKESRALLIAKPAGYDQETERYPVLYLLDGEEDFAHVAGIVSFLGETERIPKMLLVGIVNTNRSRDLTPPTQSESDLRWTPVTGGADAFLRFVADELVPYIDRTYRTRPLRLIAGHSVGGLFAIHALITRPALFQGVIAASPSLVWNHQATATEAAAFFSSRSEFKADLYITSADEGGGMRSAIDRLSAALEEKPPIGFRWAYRPMPSQTHPSTTHLSYYQGLDWIFDGWHLADPLALYDRGGLEAVHRHFREGARRFGFERSGTPPFNLSLLVAALFQAGRLDEAGAVLLHDPKSYPPPWNQLDSLAGAYARRNDRTSAIRYYKLSLEANPKNDNATKRLAELEK